MIVVEVAFKAEMCAPVPTTRVPKGEADERIPKRPVLHVVALRLVVHGDSVVFARQIRISACQECNAIPAMQYQFESARVLWRLHAMRRQWHVERDKD